MVRGYLLPGDYRVQGRVLGLQGSYGQGAEEI